MEKKYAETGKQFLLTKYGYQKTPDYVKHEREVGKPVKGFETSVPASWVEKEYVVEGEQAIG